MLKDGCIAECPGCKHRELSEEESLIQKKNFLKKILEGLDADISEFETMHGQQRWNYRRKICLKIAMHEGDWKMGMIKKKIFIPIINCPIHNININKAAELILKSIPKDKGIIPVYYTHSGNQIVLVLKNKNMPDLNWINDELDDKLKMTGIEGLWIHLHPSAGKKVYGKTGWYLIKGKETSIDNSGLQYGPTTFMQQIPELYRKALDRAFQFFSLKSGDIVIDLYSGIGASLRRWKKAGDIRIIGTELNGEAVESAKVNAPYAEILRGKCSDRIPQIESFVKANNSNLNKIVVFANPPRTGLETELLTWLTEVLKPARIAYLSCSPGTLRRDLTILREIGFETGQIIPFDFFPQTYHTEALALIRKK